MALLLFAADIAGMLQKKGALTAATFATYQRSLMRVGERAVKYGYDATYGGVFNSGYLRTTKVPSEAGSKAAAAAAAVVRTPAADLTKVWWVQAESILALWRLYQYTSDVSYRDKLLTTLCFIDQHLIDHEFGEWYWQVDRSGALMPDTAPGLIKGSPWKASYHNGRALMYLATWMKCQ